jgi:hypothetical protein
MEQLREQQGEDATPPDQGNDEGFDTALPDPTGDDGRRDEGGGGSWTPGWIIAAVGGAMIAGGVITGVMTLGVQSDLDERCPVVGEVRMCSGEFEDDRDGGETLALVTDLLLFGGIAVGALGAVLALSLGGGDGAESATAACGPGGCALRVRF